MSADETGTKRNHRNRKQTAYPGLPPISRPFDFAQGRLSELVRFRGRLLDKSEINREKADRLSGALPFITAYSGLAAGVSGKIDINSGCPDKAVFKACRVKISTDDDTTRIYPGCDRECGSGKVKRGENATA